MPWGSGLGGCAATGGAGGASGALAPIGGPQALTAYSVGLSADPAPPLRLGEALSLRLRASAPSHGALYLLRSDGGVTILSERLALDAEERRFPPEGADFALRAAPPAGLDRILLVGSSAPLPPAGSGFAAPHALCPA